jgi:RNA polymerase sigma-70 factor (ECF subfamily)
VEDLPLVGEGPDAFEQAARRERLERLEAALKGLGERCREIFSLKIQGVNFIEIQKQLKVGSLNTLYSWDFRCRKQLLEKLGGSWDQKQ